MANQVQSAQMDSKVDQLHSLAESLVAKFEQGDGTNYIDEAIVLDREAFELYPPGHSERYLSLTWLGIHLSDRYDPLGAMTGLEETIVLNRDVPALRSLGHLDCSVSSNNVAVDILTWYKYLTAIDDLNKAIVLEQDVLVLHPLGHSKCSMFLNNLAAHLSTGTQLGAMEDLDIVIVLN